MLGLLDGRVRDLAATADKQLTARAYDAAIDTYRTALGELAGEDSAGARRELEVSLDAAIQAKENARRAAVALADARFHQTAGRLPEAYTAASEAFTLDPSSGADELRDQLLRTRPELATITLQILEPIPVPVEVPALEAVAPPEPEPVVPEPDPPAQRPAPASPRKAPPVEPPTFQLLEVDNPDRRRRDALIQPVEPELLSILDPTPQPWKDETVRNTGLVLSILMLCVGLVSAVLSFNSAAPRTPPRTVRQVYRAGQPGPVSIPEEQVYQPRDVDVRPVLVSKVDPEVPPELRAPAGEVSVLLYAQIDADGYASHMRVLDGPTGFGAAALQAASHWRFRPGIKGGKPVTVAVRLSVNFRRP